jgi:hypothetical protein
MFIALSILLAFLAVLACGMSVWGIGSEAKSDNQDFNWEYTSSIAMDQRLAAADNGLALGSYGSGSVSLWDTGGAEVEQFGEAALSAMEKVSSKGFDSLDTMTKSVIGMLNNAGENQFAVTQATSNNNKALLDAITELGKTTATGGQSDMNQTLLYIAVAGMAGLAAIVYFMQR